MLETIAQVESGIKSIGACGGTARSLLFILIYADIYDVPSSKTEVSDAPMPGDAILAYYGKGNLSESTHSCCENCEN